MENNGNQTPYWNERTAIHYRMNQLQGEMKAVRDEYERLFDRLRDLDRIEAQQKQEQPNHFAPYSPPAPTPLHNQVESSPVNTTENVVEENTFESEVDKESEEVKQLIEELPKEDKKKFTNPEVLNEVLAVLQRTRKEKSDTNTNDEKGKESNPKKTNPIKRTTKNKKVLSKKEEIKAKKETVIRALQESENMRAKELSALLEEQDLKVNNITSFLTELGKEVKEVQRVDRGVYAWVEEELEDSVGETLETKVEPESGDTTEENEANETSNDSNLITNE